MGLAICVSRCVAVCCVSVLLCCWVAQLLCCRVAHMLAFCVRFRVTSSQRSERKKERNRTPVGVIKDVLAL